MRDPSTFKEKSLTNIPYLLSFFIVFFIIFPLGLAVSIYEYKNALNDLKRHEQEASHSITFELMIEMENIFSILRFLHNRAEKHAKEDVQHEASRIHRTIEDVLWKEKLNADYARKVLRSALRPIRFGKGQGYYFAFSKDGTAQVFPLATKLEKTNILESQNPYIRETIGKASHIVNTGGSGFIRYKSFFPAADGRRKDKIAFFKYIPSIEWIIGASVFLDAYESDAQSTFLEIIEQLSYPKGNFHFLVDASGRITVRLFQMRQDDKKIADIAGKISRQPSVTEKCYPLESMHEPYTVCSRHFEAWDWVVGLGLNTAHIQEEIEKGRQALSARLTGELFFFIGILAVVAIAVLLIGRHLKFKIEKSFSVFESFFNTASQEKMPIDMNTLDIVEFQKLGVVANEMVDKLKRRDLLIQDYTDKLEQTNQDLKQANKRLDSLASRDGLTGVFNRRYFDHSLKRELARSQREKIPLSLFLIDIDFFKTYNDTYGHQKGDSCLIKVASALSNLCRRPADLFARFGGEEFAAVLPATDKRSAISIAERMQRTVAGIAIPHESSAVSPWVTFSLGVVSLVPDQSATVDGLIEMADKALYEAKEQGRDRFVVAE